MFKKRENEADLYCRLSNLYIPINKTVKAVREYRRGRMHERCSHRCELARDKEASETKNMQTTALHASLTAHQTFIA